MNHAVILKSRPSGVPTADNFASVECALPALADGQIHVRNHYLSVDPAMRGWLSDASGYSDPIAIGEVMRSFAVGEIVATRSPHFVVGQKVVGFFGWQEEAIVSADAVLFRVPTGATSLSRYLGVLGINGITAYFGLLDVCQPRAGETVVVSTAAGAVGSCAGQIAKLMGCRTVGITGGPDKVSACLADFGYDEAIDYRGTVDLDSALAAACPDGIDVYFDNTSGTISDAVLRHIRIGARIAICGTAAIASWSPWPLGERPNRHLLVKRATMRGFLATDYRDRFDEAVAKLTHWVGQGLIRYREDILVGLETAPTAISRLYAGENSGKLLIALPAAKD